MPSITFHGVELRNASRVPAAATFHFCAELTAAIAKHLEWGDLPDGSKKSAMDGQLAGGSFTLTPKDKKQQSIEGTRPEDTQKELRKIQDRLESGALKVT